ELEPPAFAMTRIGDAHVGAGGEPHPRQRRTRRLAELGFLRRRPPETKRVSGVRLYRKRHVLDCGEVEKQRGDLKRAGKTKLAPAKNRQTRDVLPIETDDPCVARDLTRELTDQRGL